MSLPVLRLRGAPYEQGKEHGRKLRERIVRNVEVYLRRFERDVKLAPADALAHAKDWALYLSERSPEYSAGMRGLTDGSGVGFAEIALLNFRYEILYYQWTRQYMALAKDGCTSFAVLPEASANGHLLLGQNWDWIPGVQGAVLHTIPSDGPETLGFTEAGIFGPKIGLNAWGLGLCINGMTSTGDDWDRMSKPFHVRCYEILRCRYLDDAVQVVTCERRANAANFLIAQAPNKAVDIEAAPEAADVLGPVDSVLVHANHFTDPQRIGVKEPPNPRRVYSCHRHERLAALINEKKPVSVEDLRTFLKDHEGHPNSLCRHEDPSLPEDQRSVTLASVIMDLEAKTLEISDRQPCENPYQKLELGSGRKR
jgi:isopenicillin-N N-acyltransferase-like protein